MAQFAFVISLLFLYSLGTVVCHSVKPIDICHSKPSFSSTAYAAFRPIYPLSLYERILRYHQGPRRLCVDLGCGHGPMARVFANHFDRVIGCDPSSGMVRQARSSIAKVKVDNIEFVEASAESLPFLRPESVDLIVAGQAAHWFDTSTFWPEMKRVVARGGTLALWGYKDHVFVDFPEATRVLNEYTYGASAHGLGRYWEAGRSKVRDKLRSLQPPPLDWEEIERIEYEPGTRGPRSGEGTMFLDKEFMIEECMEYVRTWSAFSAWQDAHPDKISKSDGGEGDIVDEMFEAMRVSEQDWRKSPQWKKIRTRVEWGSALILARKRSMESGDSIDILSGS